jgi:fucose 4-O-acetylase-like acetyltransferase
MAHSMGLQNRQEVTVKKRDATIDVLKGMLVFGMVLSHVSGLVSSYDGFPMKHVWLFTGLITFSGFVFSFGYACQLAYFSKEFHSVYQRMLSTAFKPLVAFYISGVYWRAFVDKKLSVGAIANILILNDIPPFSEFLVSFSLIILVSLLLFKPIQRLTSQPKPFWMIVALLLLSTFVPYSLVSNSQVGLLIGTDRFPVYPVLQYFPIYLLGIYFAKHKLTQNQLTLAISSVGIVLFLIFQIVNHQTPGRFPPSFSWILASIFFVYVYYLLARLFSKWGFIAQILSGWGRNVLFYLLVSNIMIFTFRGAYEKVYLSPLASLGATVAVLFTIHFLITIVSSQKALPSTHHQPLLSDYQSPSYDETRIKSLS